MSRTQIKIQGRQAIGADVDSKKQDIGLFFFFLSGASCPWVCWCVFAGADHIPDLSQLSFQLTAWMEKPKPSAGPPPPSSAEKEKIMALCERLRAENVSRESSFHQSFLRYHYLMDIHR
jgi:hypothetical protein